MAAIPLSKKLRWVETLKEHVKETMVGQDSRSVVHNDKDVKDKGSTKYYFIKPRP